ncbi:unnamed protein product [Tetraodon nigroviridis]|uniref:(spotted green pufferfish) hypothetical protein n=1 Tax=Tetraodon nigroviridis TaxID=99883 RepID=Q4T3D0_TETNG|nr:unnamed protein product [Tetraodon nigroviridis]
MLGGGLGGLCSLDPLIKDRIFVFPCQLLSALSNSCRFQPGTGCVFVGLRKSIVQSEGQQAPASLCVGPSPLQLCGHRHVPPCRTSVDLLQDGRMMSFSGKVTGGSFLGGATLRSDHQTSPLFWPQPRRCWIEETFSRRECVRFLPSSRDLHRCSPGCQVCQNLIRCCCGRLIGEHAGLEAPPPAALQPGVDSAEDWSTERHTRASPTNAFGTIDFQDRASRVCRAKYVRLAVDTRAELLLQLMLKEWQMERPKLLLSVQGASENFTLAPKVMQAFSRGLMAAALSTGAWILTDGTNTGTSAATS